MYFKFNGAMTARVYIPQNMNRVIKYNLYLYKLTLLTQNNLWIYSILTGLPQKNSHLLELCQKPALLFYYTEALLTKNYRFISFSVKFSVFLGSYAVIMGCECRSPSQLYGLLYIQVVPVFLEVARTKKSYFWPGPLLPYKKLKSD